MKKERRSLDSDMSKFRCHVDIVDMSKHADGAYQFFLNYVDCNTNFVRLIPLRTNHVDEIASHVAGESNYRLHFTLQWIRHAAPPIVVF